MQQLAGTGPALSAADVERLAADYAGLTDVALRHSFEAEHGLFIAEGDLVLRRAVAAGYRLRSVLAAPARSGLACDILGPARAAVPVLVADHDELQATTGFAVHRGLLASVVRPRALDPRRVLAGTDRVLVCEGLNNTTNLGAVLRSAAALGMGGVLLDPRCCDPLYRRAVRVSMGEVFALPWARLPDWPADLRLLREAGFRVLALTPAADAEDLAGVATGGKIALLLGAEGPGLSPGALAAADDRVRIPMAAGVDSLNVAAAAAVACYALRRPP